MFESRRYQIIREENVSNPPNAIDNLGECRENILAFALVF